ncbi:hypothetical protein [Sphingomonas sp. VNH70]|uniref:hypothetical protein n=1 Tax=Sphingomonas silueang TaxID=3156617 RepID=UPI0032B5630B
MVRLLAFAGLTAPQTAPAQQVAHQGDGYTVYLVRPQFCMMDLDTGRGARVRFAYRRDTGEVGFSYVRQGFPPVAANRSFPVFIQFQGVSRPTDLVVTGYTGTDGMRGFAGRTNAALIDAWGKHSGVTIRLGDDARTPIETIPLHGSANAVNHFTACTLPDYSVTVMPPSPEEMGMASTAPDTPSAQTALGTFTVRCNGNAASTYHAGRELIGKGPACDESGKPELSASSKFKTGEQILLVTKPVSATISEGSIVHIKAGTPPRVVNIDYMTEFGAIIAVNKVQVVSSGQLNVNAPRAEWRCELTLNWANGTIASQREVGSRTGMCNEPSPTITKSAPAKPVGATPTREWLAGGWVAQGTYCASGDAISIRSDGTYFIGHHTNGTWRLADGKLHVAFKVSDIDGEDGPVERKSPGIVKLGQNDLLLGGDRMKRCPANGGIEPWHPKVRFGVR